MEYHNKKTQILQSVQYTNLLSFTLAENKLERNFKSIVQFLLLNQEKIDSLNSQHILVKEKHSNEIYDLYQKFNQLKSELKNQKKHQQKSIVQQLSDEKISKKQLSKKQLTSKQTLMKDTADIRKQTNCTNIQSNDKTQLMIQINDLKQKFGMFGYIQNELDNVKKDLQALKGEVITVSNNIIGNNQNIIKSTKSLIKRDLILNKDPSSHSMKVLLDNKQNNQSSLQSNIKQLIDKSLSFIYLDINTFKISFDQIRDMLSNVKKQCFQNNLSFNQLKQDFNKQIKIHSAQISYLEKQVKQLKISAINFDTFDQENDEKQEKNALNKQTNSNKDRGINYKDQLNDKLSKMQRMITQLSIHNEFDQFKAEAQLQFYGIQSKFNQFETTQQDLQFRISENERLCVQEFEHLRAKIDDLNEQIHNQCSQSERKDNILSDRLQQMKVTIKSLRQDVQFCQALSTQTKPQKLDSFNIIQPRQVKGSIDHGQDLKKILNNKLNQMRNSLLCTIRQVQKKISTKVIEQQIIKLWDRLNQTSLFMQKKADQDDTRKTMAYMQKKLSRITMMIPSADTQDARIARSSVWQCLSCDKDLKNYEGKVGRHMTWQSMPLKGINKSNDRKGLPLLKK